MHPMTSKTSATQGKQLKNLRHRAKRFPNTEKVVATQEKQHKNLRRREGGIPKWSRELAKGSWQKGTGKRELAKGRQHEHIQTERQSRTDCLSKLYEITS